MKNVFLACLLLAAIALSSCESKTVEPELVGIPKSNLGYVQVEFVYRDGTTEYSKIMDIKK